VLGEQGAGGKCVEFYLKSIVYADDRLNTGQKPDLQEGVADAKLKAGPSPKQPSYMVRRAR
jgi:hypothetical protein